MGKGGYNIGRYVKSAAYVAGAVVATVIPGGYAVCAIVVYAKRHKRKKAEAEKEREKESELVDIID